MGLIRKDEISWGNITGTCQDLAGSRQKFGTIITLQKCINLFCEIRNVQRQNFNDL